MLPKVVDQWFSHWVSECLTVLSTVFRIICRGCSSSWNFGYRLMSWCIHNSIVEFLSWPLISKSQQSVPALFWHKNFWFYQLLWCFLYQFPPNSSRTHRNVLSFWYSSWLWMRSLRWVSQAYSLPQQKPKWHLCSSLAVPEWCKAIALSWFFSELNQEYGYMGLCFVIFKTTCWMSSSSFPYWCSPV